jgi:hypothetical protein
MGVMAEPADTMKLEAPLGVADRAPRASRAGSGLAFHPEMFFLGRTDGAGVVRDPFGRIVRRCRVATEGAHNPTQPGIRFDEVFSYDDGEIDTWRWVMTAGRDGRYVAAEAKAGAGITGERRGEEYVLAFRRPVGRLGGVLAPHFRTSFTLLSADTALKRAAVSLGGLPLGVLTAVHRRVS